MSIGEHLLTYNQTSMYLLDFKRLIEAGRTDCLNCIKQINISLLLTEGESVSCLEAVDSQNIIIGTNRGNIIGFDIKEEEIVTQMPIATKTRRAIDTNNLASSL